LSKPRARLPFVRRHGDADKSKGLGSETAPSLREARGVEGARVASPVALRVTRGMSRASAPYGRG